MSEDRLSITLSALADPTRRAILARLADGEATVGELAAPFAMSLPAVSRHLKVLERAGLIARGRDAQWRPCRLEAAPLARARELARALPAVLGGRARPARRLPGGVAEGKSAMDTIIDALTTETNTLHLERRLRAPRELVFRAWTEPAHLRRWSAPHGFDIPECDGELRPGGSWHARWSRRRASGCGFAAPTAR